MMRNYSSLWGGRILFLIFSTLFFLQNLSFGQLHTTPTCITQYDLIWDSTPTGSGEVNWSTPGSLSNTFSNVDNSGIDFSFSFTGDVSTLGDWNNLGGNVTPSIGTNSSNGGVEVLEYFTDGFNSVGNITITITFSQPISSIGFDIYHVNGAGPNGDSYTITAGTATGGTIYPTFTSSATPSYTTNSTGFLNSVDNSVAGDNANVGVNFSDSDGITSITMIWDECTACTAGTVHGSAFSNFTFCKIENYDNDNDGIADNIDLDDDNDGIPDEIESCGSISGGGNVDINVEIQLDNYPGESSWTLQNSGGTTVASGSGYSTANQFIDLTYNLPADDYTFTMNDTYGDGLQDVGGYHQVKVDGSIVFGPITTTFFTHQNTFTAGVGAFSCISGNPSEDADNDGILNYQDADFCTLNGNGVCNNLDTDGDGIIDQFDLDSDGDGCYDAEEAGHGQTILGDNTIATSSDVGANGMDNDVETNDGENAAINYSIDETNSGTFDFQSNSISTSCPVVLIDTDGDGVADVNDLDSDNDGIPDVLERACDDSSVANSASGSGAYQDKLYFFNWDGTDLTDGIHEGDSQTFNLANGISITATFSNVVNANTYIPSDMNTWGGAILHQLYNTSGVSEALYGADGADASFTVTFVATKNGIPFSLDLLALDAESTYPGSETLSFTTNGGVWTAFEKYNGGGVWTGVNSTTVQASDTEVSGGNTIFYSEGASTIDVVIDAGGREAVAFGIVLFCDEDGDGIPNYLDLDSDNDGIPDIIEAGGIDTNGDGVMDYPTANDPTSMVDVDGDGLADSVDNLDNGGGVNEVTNGTPLPNQDTDGDGLTDNVDLDADNDGIPDIIESGGVDSNGDGIVDNLLDNDLDGFADIYDPDDDGISGIDSGEGGQPLVETDGSGNYLNGETGVSLDTDGDGLADHLDLDADNDGIPDLVEAGGIDTNGDGMVDVLTDVDGDGFADIYDTDDDGFVGIEDSTDALLKTGGTDTDADGKADDAAITYVDGDNISSDTDGDGYVDHLDLDSDNDGIPDIIEVGGISPNSDGKVDLSAAPWDSDNDGLADIYDEDNSGTALVKTTAESGTADGKVGASESMIGGSSNNVNVDNDPFPNHLDLDADNDGITDVVENAGGDVTADNTSGTLDGIVGDNSTVTDTDDNGWHDSSNTNTTDSDGDGIADYLDIDADNDGIVDYLEGVCSTCPTFVLDPNSNLTDSNENGVLDIYESLTAANGTSGSNIGVTPNIDDDAINTIPDYLDTDADNDGANDWTEGYDLNNNGQASDDLKTMATNYEAATNNNYYLNTNDADADGIPDWLDNQPAVAGYDETSRPPFLDPNSPFWHDDDNDGLVDLLDSSQSGTNAPTPDNNGGNDLDWRDVTSLARLPVELSSFVVKEKDCLVELNWVTESESQFDYFEIEWSGDGHEFLKFGQVLNNGNANGSSYNLIDDNPSFTNYYRLKMVDLDGSFEYSKVVFIKLKCAKTKGEALVYPNPISPSQMLNIEFLSEQDSEQIVLVDMVGRIVRRLNLETEIGKNKISMEISDLAVGSYQLQIVGSRKSYMILIQE